MPNNFSKHVSEPIQREMIPEPKLLNLPIGFEVSQTPAYKLLNITKYYDINSLIEQKCSLKVEDSQCVLIYSDPGTDFAFHRFDL